MKDALGHVHSWLGKIKRVDAETTLADPRRVRHAAFDSAVKLHLDDHSVMMMMTYLRISVI